MTTIFLAVKDRINSLCLVLKDGRPQNQIRRFDSCQPDSAFVIQTLA